ncbi:MAG: hypothetical protein IT545_00210 [Rhodobacteraceae bacterium]|nr:hypothetical protein [Paracoccaceae bacterium]
MDRPPASAAVKDEGRRRRSHRRRPSLRRMLALLPPGLRRPGMRLVRAVLEPFEPLSRLTHDLIFHDVSQSLCARAWEMRDRHRFWRGWVRFFGPRHCRDAFRYHCERRQALYRPAHAA